MYVVSDRIHKSSGASTYVRPDDLQQVRNGSILERTGRSDVNMSGFRLTILRRVHSAQRTDAQTHGL